MVVSVPLLSPTFEQPDEGAELFSCRVKTGLWNIDRVRAASDVVFVVEVIEGGGSESSGGTRRGESSTSSTRHEAIRRC